MTATWHPAPRDIPTDPGVYRFFDADDRILYVGKAKNLRNRLSTYFHSSSSMLQRTQRMVATARRVDWNVVGTELEALHLEFTWIKEFKPPFNIQFRDDKGYPYLSLSMGEEFPRAALARKRDNPYSTYWGPFTKAWAVRETMDMLLTVYPVRSCEKGVFNRARSQGRPCLLGDIDKCAAPCVGRVTAEEHRAIAQGFSDFMTKQDSSVVADLDQQMRDASDRMDFERAAKFRDQRNALNSIMERSAVVLAEALDIDVLGFAASELAASLHIFHVRGGRVRGVRSWNVDTELELDPAVVLEHAIELAYDTEIPPPLIDVPFMPESSTSLSTMLSSRRRDAGHKTGVKMSVPHRGDRAALVESVNKNARLNLAEYQLKRSVDFTARSQALEDLRDAIGMAQAPLRFECFDVSHLGGTDIVGSNVVFEEGLPLKDAYRHFAISDATDDTDAMYQLVSRRLQKLSDELPAMRYPTTMLLIDGGQPQVAAAARAVHDSGITGLTVCGIAKRLEELWLPDSDYPVILGRSSEALFMVQRARDESHRFALRFQTTKRTRILRTALHDIPGLGERRVRDLLKAFGSPTALRKATPEEISRVQGIGPSLAQRIVSALAQSSENG